jgi:hypothetical protein
MTCTLETTRSTGFSRTKQRGNRMELGLLAIYRLIANNPDSGFSYPYPSQKKAEWHPLSCWFRMEIEAEKYVSCHWTRAVIALPKWPIESQAVT